VPSGISNDERSIAKEGHLLMTVVLRAQAGLNIVDDEFAVLADHRQVSRENTAERRRLLGEFIRSRRERTTPDMVGMPPGLRRRTPGLRREEVALLSGIGITWYTWLEQGRPINVSGQVLQSVARVLHLDASERAHIFALAELADPQQSTEAAQVGAGVQLLLDQLDPLPAVVLGPRLDILAGNRAHLGLLGDYYALPFEYRNIMWMFFTDPHWRTLVVHWEENARRMAAKLRTAMAEHVGDPGWAALLERLERNSPEFREMWERQEVAPIENCIKQYRHLQAGTLDVEVSHFWLSDQRAVRMTVYTPLNDATRERLDVLMSIRPRELPLPTTHTESTTSRAG
jgi:transcriptional regulator with XRE-family HTH domain